MRKSGDAGEPDAPGEGIARRHRLRVLALDCVLVLAVGALVMYVVSVLANGADSDITVYAGYASQFWGGTPRFHLFPQEYPPLTVLLFSLTMTPRTTSPIAQWELWMFLVFFLGWLLFYRFSGRAAAWRYALYVLALGIVGFARFDLVPGVLCVGVLWAARQRAWIVSALLLALATLLKFYPAVLLPLLVIEAWRGSGQRVRAVLAPLGTWLVVVGGGLLVPYLLNPASLTSILGYQSGRPVEVESIFGTIAWLGSLVGIAAPSLQAYSSFNFGGPIAAALAPLSTPLLVLGVVVVYAWVWRRRLPLGRAFLLCLGVVMLTDKVLSAQYLLWVLPLAAEDGGDMWLWLAIALLTQIEYPILFGQFFRDDATRWIFMLAVLARNTLLCVAIARVARHPSKGEEVCVPAVMTGRGGVARGRAPTGVAEGAVRSTV